MTEDVNILKQQLLTNLQSTILIYWVNNAVDEHYGGFVGEIDHQNKICHQANKGIILNTRILWTFSSAYLFFKNEKYLELADRAYQYLLNYFHDKDNGGVYWELDCKGNPVNTRKQIYAQAFTIYALSEYYKINQNEDVLKCAKEIYFLLEQHSFDSNRDGYFEAFTKEWKALDDVRLSDKDMNEQKTMNTHLHILEAYTNLYRIFPDKQLHESLQRLIHVFQNYFINKDFHLNLFFDENWNLKSNIISYGHDIECAWLLYEAADVLNDDLLKRKISKISVQIADVFLNEGIDKDGGIWNEKDLASGHLDTDKHWWQQAEAMVGLYNAYELSGEKKYLEAVFLIWTFIDKNIVDHKNGEWFWRVDIAGKPYQEVKAGMWKCPYHNTRACLELIHRIGNSN